MVRYQEGLYRTLRLEWIVAQYLTSLTQFPLFSGLHWSPEKETTALKRSCAHVPMHYRTSFNATQIYSMVEMPILILYLLWTVGFREALHWLYSNISQNFKTFFFILVYTCFVRSKFTSTAPLQNSHFFFFFFLKKEAADLIRFCFRGRKKTIPSLWNSFQSTHNLPPSTKLQEESWCLEWPYRCKLQILHRHWGFCNKAKFIPC